MVSTVRSWVPLGGAAALARLCECDGQLVSPALDSTPSLVSDLHDDGGKVVPFARQVVPFDRSAAPAPVRSVENGHVLLPPRGAGSSVLPI
jgi:hypothetical protein